MVRLVAYRVCIVMIESMFHCSLSFTSFSANLQFVHATLAGEMRIIALRKRCCVSKNFFVRGLRGKPISERNAEEHDNKDIAVASRYCQD